MSDAAKSEETVKHAKLPDLKRIIRKKLSRREEEMETSLNIYPMMDMMTILLVFMIMNFATESARIMQSAELQIPTSISTVQAKAAIVVQISSTTIIVEGKPILQLRNGTVD